MIKPPTADERRLADAMRSAVPALVPDPRIVDGAVRRARTSRRRRWLATSLTGALALLLGWGALVTVLHGGSADAADDLLAVDAEGVLVVAPTWAGCDIPEPRVGAGVDVLVDAGPGLEAVTDPRAVAWCGPTAGSSDRALEVRVGGAHLAGALLAALRRGVPGEPPGCVRLTCTQTRLTLLDASGAVVELELWSDTAGGPPVVAGWPWRLAPTPVVVDPSVLDLVAVLAEDGAVHRYDDGGDDGEA